MVQRIRVILFSALYVVLNSPFLPAQESPVSNPSQRQFVRDLFDSRQYYRALSEIYRLEYHSGLVLDKKINLILLSSHYHLDQHEVVIDRSKHLLEASPAGTELAFRYEIGKWMTASYIDLEKPEQAEISWERYCAPYDPDPFPSDPVHLKRIDPDRARLYSAILPGSGLLMSGEYGKATVSFLLNALFIAGIYHFGSDQQYGIAGLLTFFEVGWYAGGQKAAYEAAENYNRTTLHSFQKDWISSKLH